MTKKIITLFAALFILLGNVSAQQIKWSAIEQAAKTERTSKLYFVDFYTSWCGWCKKMDRETFKDPVVIKILNTYYIPVKFDAEGNADFTWNGTRHTAPTPVPGSRATTHSFAKAVLGRQMGFPSFGIFNSDQSLVTILQGYQTSNDLVMILWYLASGDNRKYSFEKYQKIFDKDIRPVMNQKLGIN